MRKREWERFMQFLFTNLYKKKITIFVTIKLKLPQQF